MAEQFHPPSDALQRLLAAHRRWIETDGEEGQQLTDENAGWQFKNLRLDGACFRNAELADAEFVGCSLMDADFACSSLQDALFKNCDLTGSSFEGANLQCATFRTNNVENVSFRGANTNLADLPNITRSRTQDDLAAILLAPRIP